MPKIPLMGGSYEARSIIADLQRCVNLYPEPNPQDAEAPFTHYLTPGLTVLALGTTGQTNPTPPATTAFLNVGDTSFTVPAGVLLLISVELWGSGTGNSTNNGGAGAYSALLNVAVTPGQVFTVNIPPANSGATLDNAACWFGSLGTAIAQSGAIGTGNGGDKTFGIGTVTRSGGNAGNNGGAGGGGAGGPHGDGKAGGGNADRFHGSAGGGGADGGTVGASVDGATNSGGNGGTNFAGQLGGAGGGVGGPGANATNPGTGGGGSGNNNDGVAVNGGNGASDTSNGGGGGGGATEDQTSSGAIGGNGGFPGGGGGRSRWGTSGAGAAGQIKISWNA